MDKESINSIKTFITWSKNRGAVHEYYTNLKWIWEGIEALSDLPVVTTINEDVTNFVIELFKKHKSSTN